MKPLVEDLCRTDHHEGGQDSAKTSDSYVPASPLEVAKLRSFIHACPVLAAVNEVNRNPSNRFGLSAQLVLLDRKRAFGGPNAECYRGFDQGLDVDSQQIRCEVPLMEALDVFQQSAIASEADQRLLVRLIDVQELVGDDLEWVESALDRVARDGTSPATEAAHHLVSRGGKRVRPLVVLLSAACFGGVSPNTRSLALVSELIHTATLLHDDVADEGMQRRGAATSRRVWGNAVSVLAGDLLLVQALTQTLVDMPSVLPELLLTLRQMVDGEVLQLRGRTQLHLSEEHYFQIVRGKTASLFAWAARSGALSSGASSLQAEALGTFGDKLGIAFQLVDDVLDYIGTKTGKTSLADLREGKLTLPLVVAVQRCPELQDELQRIHAGEEDRLDIVASQVIQTGACDEVRARALLVTEEALAQLTHIAVSPAVNLLKGVAEDLVARLG
jgi:octaprenyl-diphosphate synthase